MSFHGHQGKGAMAAHRARKRKEAEVRAERATAVRTLRQLGDEVVNALPTPRKAPPAQGGGAAVTITRAGVFVDGQRTRGRS